MIMDEYDPKIERRAENIMFIDETARTANTDGAAFLNLVHNPTLVDDLAEAQRAAIFSGLRLLGEPAQSFDPADYY